MGNQVCTAACCDWYQAASENNLPYFVSNPMLMNQINTPNEEGRTALYLAARAGNLKIVQHLVERGADIDCLECNVKSTPLHVAAYRGHAQVVQYLMGMGARRDIENKFHQTPSREAKTKEIQTMIQFCLFLVKWAVRASFVFYRQPNRGSTKRFEVPRKEAVPFHVGTSKLEVTIQEEFNEIEPLSIKSVLQALIAFQSIPQMGFAQVALEKLLEKDTKHLVISYIVRRANIQLSQKIFDVIYNFVPMFGKDAHEIIRCVLVS